MGSKYTEGVSTTLEVSHVEIISRRERDDRLSQNPVVCLVFSFIARREGVAVPVAGLAGMPRTASKYVQLEGRKQASKIKGAR